MVMETWNVQRRGRGAQSLFLMENLRGRFGLGCVLCIESVWYTAVCRSFTRLPFLFLARVFVNDIRCTSSDTVAKIIK